MHICFVAEGYPTEKDPFMPFIRELAAQLVRQGEKISVIAPQSVPRAVRHRLPLRPKHWLDRITDTGCIDVYQPYYFTFSGFGQRISRKSLIASVKKAFSQIAGPIDALYAHFWHMGAAASMLPSQAPLFVACGESRIEVREHYGEEELAQLQKRLSGVVYVGTKSYRESLDLGLQKDTTPYLIAPNGFDASLFYPQDKALCRKKLGWDENAFVCGFVGAFSERKGLGRLCAAISASEEPICGCFIGSGSITPDCENVLFCGRLPHDRIAAYLGGCDVFVLPTENEGCCNAIVEALGCGLPVISADRLFNDDILDGSCSVRIDPTDVCAIRDAILRLKHDPALCKKLAEGARQKAAGLAITERAAKIAAFIRK